MMQCDAVMIIVCGAERTRTQEIQMAVERTLSIIKPDAVAKNVLGEI